MQPRKLFAIGLAVALLVGDVRAAEPAPLELPGIENAFDLGAGVLSGSAPEGEAAFAELARRGVKTIVSVDGTPPDVALAHRFGLRYVHLPFGYDGIPTARANELAKVATTIDGPVYVHCHHGKHRGPAAAAIMCAAREGWTGAQGEAWLREAGTAADYAGLFRSVREFRLPGAEALAALSTDFPERAKTPPLVDAMVAIDERLDVLKSAQRQGWPTSTAQAATLLWEQLRELSRDAEVQKKPDDFLHRLADAERAASVLRELLRTPEIARPRCDAALQQVAASCTDCHRQFRNVRPAR